MNGPDRRGLTCNGHTGEITSLRPEERHRVARVVAETVGREAPRTQDGLRGLRRGQPRGGRYAPYAAGGAVTRGLPGSRAVSR